MNGFRIKKTLLSLALALSFSVLLVAGCTGPIVGAGNTVSKQYDFEDFNAVAVGSCIDVRISPADTYSITVSTQESIFEHLDISQSGKTLSIRFPSLGCVGNKAIQAVITMPEVASLDLFGACKGTVQDFKSTNDLDLRVSGASQLNISNLEAGRIAAYISGASKLTGQFEAQNTQLTVSGAGRCELSGSTADATLDISGASQAITQDLQIQNADVSVSGASRATINANGTLNVDVTGASTLQYLGNPTLNRVNVTGGSRISRQ